MILKRGTRHVLLALAIAVVALNLFGMTPAAAAAHPCRDAHAQDAADHHDPLGLEAGCCQAMHCCPMLPALPAPGLPPEARLLPHDAPKTDRPLLLDGSLDPPPRTPAA